MTRLRSRIALEWWGVLGVLLLALAGWLVFAGGPRARPAPFELRAVFRSDAQLMERSPVRIAGVDVGRVTGIDPVGRGSDAAVVRMDIDPAGLPLHRDARLKIRSRLLLEGNFSIELSPGSPDAPRLRSGAEIPVSQTSGPVQLDRVLSDLQPPTLRDLRTTVQGLGRASGGGPSPTGAQALNASLDDLPEALLGTSRVTDALQGMRPGDLRRVIDGQSRTLAALASRADALRSAFRGLDATMGALADRQADLRRSLALLPGTLTQTTAALTRLRAAYPPLRTFARELQPGLEELPATIEATTPWIAQATKLLREDGLRGDAALLARAAPDAASGAANMGPLLRQLGALSRCGTRTLIPTLKAEIADPPLTTGRPVYQEGFSTIVGLLGAMQNFDGNGPYLRGQTGGGDEPLQTGEIPSQGPLRGNGTAPPLGTRPAYPGKNGLPALTTTAACATQPAPDLDGAKTGASP